MSQAQFEYSAGGVVLDQDRVLVVRTTALKGREVWTFPKGLHAQGERSPQAVPREVKEEKGRVHKTVRWFLMRPDEHVGAPDSDEIDEVAWYTAEEAQKRLTYAADRSLLRQTLSNRP